jgi:hypothetical protein
MAYKEEFNVDTEIINLLIGSNEVQVVSDLVIASASKIATASQFNLLARISSLLNNEAIEKLTGCVLKILQTQNLKALTFTSNYLAFFNVLIGIG